MKIRYSLHLLLPTLMLLIFTTPCYATRESTLEIDYDSLAVTNKFRNFIVGEWLPLDTIDNKVYANYHTPFIVAENTGQFPLTLQRGRESHYVAEEEYCPDENLYKLHFKYGKLSLEIDYSVHIKIIDNNTLQWDYYSFSEPKRYYPHLSYRATRKGYEGDYTKYNNTLPEEIQNKTWLSVDGYRDEYYWRDNNYQYLITYIDSVIVQYPIDDIQYTTLIKHCKTVGDTIFVYEIYDSRPSYNFRWVDKAKKIIQYNNSYGPTGDYRHGKYMDSNKYNTELLPTLDILLEQDTDRVSFFSKWEKEGYTDGDIENFIWRRDSPDSFVEDYFEKEYSVSYEGYMQDVVLSSIKTDYNLKGKESRIVLVEDWLYEKDENQLIDEYTIYIVDGLDKDVFKIDKYIKIIRPMPGTFTINVPQDGILELTYNVYAERDYDIWEYRRNTLEDLDKVNSYTYTYKYNDKIKDWNLRKIDAIIKTPKSTKHKSIRVRQERTLYTLDPEMNPLDDIE